MSGDNELSKHDSVLRAFHQVLRHPNGEWDTRGYPDGNDQYAVRNYPWKSEKSGQPEIHTQTDIIVQ